MATRTVVVTGAASGMGRALAQRLAAQGVATIGIDRSDADVTADLEDPHGRRRAADAALSRSGGVLAGVATFAGLSGHSGRKGGSIVSVNYFGAIDTLEQLRPALAAGEDGAAVAVSSIGATVHPEVSDELVEACLAGDEATARRLGDAVGAPGSYVASKLAVNRWVRRNAPTEAWIGTGVRLNALSPGLTATPMVDEALGEASGRDIVERFRVPAGRAGRPEEQAAAAAFLLGPEARFVVGTVLTVDGGTEALLLPDDHVRRAEAAAYAPAR